MTTYRNQLTTERIRIRERAQAALSDKWQTARDIALKVHHGDAYSPNIISTGKVLGWLIRAGKCESREGGKGYKEYRRPQG